MEVSVQARWERERQHLATTLKTRTKQLFKQFRIILRALAHPGVPWHAKFVCGCAVLYVVSPIQLIPNFIPILGQMDDVLVVSLTIKLLKRSIPPTVLDDCQNEPDLHVKPCNPSEKCNNLSLRRRLVLREKAIKPVALVRVLRKPQP